MRRDLSIYDLAKRGRFAEFCRRIAGGEGADLPRVFERAVADFRTIKRNAGHHRLLHWCIEQGLDFNGRAGWLNQPVVCLAAAHGNNDIIAAMTRKGLGDNLFARAAVGDVAFLARYASRHPLRDLNDENGFNLLFYCAESALGRRDPTTGSKLLDLCRLLLDHKVSPSHEVQFALPVFPAFLCASYGGNEQVMRLLLDHAKLTVPQFHQVLEHALEPHQRSGQPFYQIAALVLEYGVDINALRADQGRTLLHGAANRGTVNAARWLLQNGADPNALDVRGRTPLHVCAERNTAAQVVQLLINAGAELNARDASGRTPLDYARENQRAKVIEYLRTVNG